MFSRSDRLRLFALLLWPSAGRPLPLGLWWLWQNGPWPIGWRPRWRSAPRASVSSFGCVGATAGCSPTPRLLPTPLAAQITGRMGHHRAMAEGSSQRTGPVRRSPALYTGRDALEQVARLYHPEKERPVLELTLPTGF